ncbi:MAG: tetratricopeptide repeat protein [Alphaproteobacteria bacterium]
MGFIRLKILLRAGAILAIAAWAVAPARAETEYDRALAAYDNGHYAEALAGFNELAKSGHAAAQFQLALMHHQGDGVPADIREGLKWYRRAADQGFAPAIYSLGLLFDQGFGVKVNPIEAVKYFKRSAELDHPQAQFTYAYMLQIGRGTPKDGPAALRWFTRAAEQGHGMALFGVGLCNRQCPGVTPNKVNTHAFLGLAIPKLQEGVMKNSATKMREKTASTMTPGELRESERVAANWQARHGTTAQAAKGEQTQVE